MTNPDNRFIWIIEPDMVVFQDLSEIFQSYLPSFEQMSFHKPEDILLSLPLPQLAAIRCGSFALNVQELVHRLSASKVPTILIGNGNRTFDQPSIYPISVPFSDTHIREVLNRIGFATPSLPLQPSRP